MTNDIEKNEKHFNIMIDRNHYKVEASTMTGQQLKALASIQEAYDLFEEQQGPGNDTKIEDKTIVPMKSGLKFFSVPNHINPGRAN